MENIDLLIKVCEWYYVDELTQQQIATRLRVSRFTVMRLLKEAVEQGVITFNIARPNNVNVVLGRQLEQKLGVWRSIVVDKEPDTLGTLAAIGEAASGILAELVRSGDVIGVSSGVTANSVAEKLYLPNPPDDLTVVQLVGSFPDRSKQGDAYQTAYTLATKLNARLAILCAPAIVDQPELRGALLSDSNIEPTIRLFSDLDVAIVGIGSLTADHSYFVRHGYISIEEQDQLAKEGVVGDVLAQFVTASGSIVASPLDNRIIAMHAEALRRVKYSIGVAAGIEKAKAIEGAIRAGFIKILVTDEAAANAIIKD